ncbi:MAG: CHC2 zinc finger domain-containing protein, partial [Geobacter sp.]
MKIDKQTIIERLRTDMSSLLQELKPDAKPAGKGKLLAHCIFPDNHTNGDANPSLLLFLDSGGYKCQACGAKGSLFDLYGHVHGLDFKQSLHALAEKTGMEVNKQVKQRVTGRYDYLDANGNIAYYKLRIEPSRDGKRSKEFVIKGPDDKPGQPTNTLLYRLPELMSSEQGEIVIFTEGEKQADLLAKWGVVATTLPHGS